MHPGKRQLNTERCHKLACLADFFNLYTANGLPAAYLEVVAGGTAPPCGDTACPLGFTARLALQLQQPFDFYILAGRDETERTCLREMATPFFGKRQLAIVPVKQWDALPGKTPRALPLLTLVDPAGYRDLRWARLEKLVRQSHDGRGRKTDLLIFLPMEMALLRNFTRPDCETSVNHLYGNREWQEVRRARQENRLTLAEAEERLAGLFKAGLQELGYRYAEDVAPLGQPISYRLFWASDTRSRRKELAAIWEKPRYLPCELLYGTPEKEEACSA